MITKFKIFENLNQGQIEVGDFVLCQIDYNSLSVPGRLSEINNALLTHIGTVNKISEYPNNIFKDWKYYIKFKIDKDEDFWYCFTFNGNEKNENYKIIGIKENEIKYWSKNKEDLDVIVKSIQYNL